MDEALGCQMSMNIDATHISSQCRKILGLFPKKYLYNRGEHRIRINMVLVVQLLDGAGLTKMDDSKGFQRSVAESPEPGKCEGMTIQERDRWHASFDSREKLIQVGRDALLRGCNIS